MPQSTNIKYAMLLAAGLGTRMRPLTDTRPKPLIEVEGKAMLDYVLDALSQAGVEQAVINAHYLADMIENHVKTRTSPHITISDERAQLLDSGGGVKKALAFLGTDPFFILNSDAIWLDGPRSNITRMMEGWDASKMDILLLLAPTSHAVGWGNKGDFSMDQHGRLARPTFGNVTPFAYAGVGIFKPELFENTPDIFSLNLLFNRAIEAGTLFGMRLEGLWMHVGTPDAVEEAELKIRASRH
jgi:N-acetyl-alpha-D-muramate 1-phosphate uridylyltransferase